MTTKAPNLSRLDFPIVTSLDNLEVGRIYRTKNYEKLKFLKFNRGKEDGYVDERVANFQAMYDRGEFRFGVPHVLVNLAGKSIDGNNKKKMLENNKDYVNFIITAEPAFNCEKESDILNNVSEYNAINSAWFDKDSYDSALAYDEPTALAIFELKLKIAKDFGGIIEDMFTPSRIVVLATKNKTGLSSVKQSRRAYCSVETADKIMSNDFVKLIDFSCKVLKFVSENNPSITPWFVLRQLMPDIWKHELSLNIVLANLKKRGFKKMDNTKMAGVKIRVAEIIKMGNVK